MNLEKNRSLDSKTGCNKFSEFIEPLGDKPKSNLTPLIMGDIETLFYQGRQYAFSFGYFVEEIQVYNDYFLTDRVHVGDSDDIIIEKSYDMIYEALENLRVLRKKLSSGTVFFHNLGKFDGIFLVEALLKKQLKPKIVSRKGDIYEIKYDSLCFRDSYKILPRGIKELENSFATKRKKGKLDISQHNFKVLNYEILAHFKEKLGEYMHNDVMLQYEIFKGAQRHFHELFGFLDISSKRTLPSIALEIFRTKFLGEDTVFKLNARQEEQIRKSYYGGGVDVYIPKGENLHVYDVNSLYPFVMLNHMPAGRPKYVTFRDKKNLDYNDFGFFVAHITFKKECHAPLLPTRLKDGITVFPRGDWTGIYFSEELKKAISVGYQVRIIRGWVFERKKLFSSYVKSIYSLRVNTDKAAINFLCKLLLNSLYGRFGIKGCHEKTSVVNAKEFLEIEKFHDISKYTKITPELYMCTYSNAIAKESVPDKNLTTKRKQKQQAFQIRAAHMNMAVHLSSAITSYARIYMYDFKNIPNNPCFYSDTDSVVLQHPLDAAHVDSKRLGAFKKEYHNARGIFLSPKIYYLQDENGSRHKFKGYSGDKLDYNWFYKEWQHGNPFKFTRISPFLKSLNPPKIWRRAFEIICSFTFQKREKTYSFFKGKEIWTGTKPLFVKNSEIIWKGPKLN